MTLAWHTSDFPELRDGPPWVMEEMIRSQVQLPGGLADADAAGAIRRAAADALAAGDEVLVIGCGTSEHGAMAVATLLADGLASSRSQARRIRSQQALDVALDPPSSGLVLAVSHDGGTRATGLALDRARDAGATTALITARPESGLGRKADHVLVTPLVDLSWCHTVAYVSAIVAGAAIAYAGSDWSQVVRATLDAALADEASRAAGKSLHPAQRVISVGMGTDLVNARELALKIEEGARIAATAHHLETVLHGHLAGCDPDGTRVVFLAADRGLADPYRRRLALAISAVTTLGLPTAVIGHADVIGSLPDAAMKVELPLPDGGEHQLLVGLLGTAVAVQWTTLGLVDAAGTNPDLIRRELEPWRVAATVAEDGGAW